MNNKKGFLQPNCREAPYDARRSEKLPEAAEASGNKYIGGTYRYYSIFSSDSKNQGRGVCRALISSIYYRNILT